MIIKQKSTNFARMLPYLLTSILFISFFVADIYKARSLSWQVPDGLPSNLFIAGGVIFIVTNLLVFFLNRQYPKRVAFTTIAIALMVGFELAFASLKFIW